MAHCRIVMYVLPNVLTPPILIGAAEETRVMDQYDEAMISLAALRSIRKYSTVTAVSYTHLDVYKRQAEDGYKMVPETCS